MVHRLLRIYAATVDLFIAALMITACLLLAAGAGLSSDAWTGAGKIGIVLADLYLLWKDRLWKKTSIGKRNKGLGIRKIDGTPFTVWDGVKRNIPLVLLLPVETVLLLVSHRRLGDVWARTEVVAVEPYLPDLLRVENGRFVLRSAPARQRVYGVLLTVLALMFVAALGLHIAGISLVSLPLRILRQIVIAVPIGLLFFLAMRDEALSPAGRRNCAFLLRFTVFCLIVGLAAEIL